MAYTVCNKRDTNLNSKVVHPFPRGIKSLTALEIPLKDNQALRLEDEKVSNQLKYLYRNSSGLYYSGQPDFDEMIRYISRFLNLL